MEITFTVLEDRLSTKNFMCSKTTLQSEREIKTHKRGLPWQSSGQDSPLSLSWPCVQALAGELRPCKPSGGARETTQRHINKITIQ